MQRSRNRGQDLVSEQYYTRGFILGEGQVYWAAWLSQERGIEEVSKSKALSIFAENHLRP